MDGKRGQLDHGFDGRKTPLKKGPNLLSTPGSTGQTRQVSLLLEPLKRIGSINLWNRPRQFLKICQSPWDACLFRTIT